MNDNFRNAMSEDGILAEGSTLPANNRNWKQNLRNAFTDSGIKVVGLSNQYIEMPDPSEKYDGKIVQYAGTTTSSFTRGYFYECLQTAVSHPSRVSISTSGISGLGNLTCDAEAFGEKVEYSDGDYVFYYNGYPETITIVTPTDDDPVTITRSREEDSDGVYCWLMQDGVALFTDTQEPVSETQFYTSSEMRSDSYANVYYYEDVTYSDTYGRWQTEIDCEFKNINLDDYSITFDGVERVGAIITITYEYQSENSNEYIWQQINVQP